jgi:hypothetical protein
MISIDLTEDQIALIQPYFDTITELYRHDSPTGAVMAQVFQDMQSGKSWMEVRYVDVDTASAIRKITGVQP